MTLQEVSQKKPNLKKRIEKNIEKVMGKMTIENPAWGQLRVSKELKKKGIFITPGSMRYVWLRHDLETFAKHTKTTEFTNVFIKLFNMNSIQLLFAGRCKLPLKNYS